MAFADVTDLEDRLRTSLDYAQAVSVLQGATDEISSACPGWQLTEMVDDVVVLQGSGSTVLSLPMPPIAEVTAVVDSAGDPVTGWTLVSTVANRQRYDRLELAGWWYEDDVYTVTYTHGYDDETRPAVLKELCLRLACRMWSNPEQVMQKRRGDYSASYGSSAVESSGLTKYELKLLTKVGLRKSAS
jgi:hypothetical protein